MRIVALLSLLLIAGCKTTPRDSATPNEKPEANPANGRLVYLRHCHECHWNGEGALGPGLRGKPTPEFLIKKQIRWGLGSMPSFSEEEISDEELRDLVGYVVALRKEQTPEPNP